MKRKFLLLPLLLLCLNAHALILSVNGYGNVPEEGLDLTIDEAEIDFFTGEPTMTLEGDLLASGPLTVTIDRPYAGLSDQFCCGQCLNGNSEKQQIMNFSPSGPSSWYAHYYPAPNSDITVTYTFSDSTDTRVIRVHYIYSTEGMENLLESTSQPRKVLKNGILYIVNDSKTYTIL
jgi:hypothetical protein